MLILSSAIFFSKLTVIKILLGTQPECQMVWTQNMTDFLMVLVWIYTIFKGYQQTIKVPAREKRVKEMSMALKDDNVSVMITQGNQILCKNRSIWEN